MMDGQPPPQYIRDIVADNVRYAELNLLEDGEVPPIVVLHADEGIRTLVLNLTDEASKNHSARIVQVCAIAWDAQIMVLVTEAWLFTGPDNEKEIVQVLVAWREGENRRIYTEAHEIVRTVGVAMGLSLIPKTWESDIKWSGIELFLVRPPSAELRARAQAIVAKFPVDFTITE